MHRRFVLTALVLGCCALPRISAADEPLPKAEQIMDKFVQATGGKAAYEKIHNEVTHGTIQISAQGLSGTVTSYHALNRTYSVIEFQGIGKLEEGFDGTVAWSDSAMQGPRIKQGDELAAAKWAAQLNQAARWRDIYRSVTTAGVEDVQGKPAYKVIAVPKEGKPLTTYYDKQSSLLVKLILSLNTPMGDMSVETYLSDYRPADGILTARQITQNIGPQSISVTVDKVEHNVDLPADRFALPEAVKKLTSAPQP